MYRKITAHMLLLNCFPAIVIHYKRLLIRLIVLLRKFCFNLNHNFQWLSNTLWKNFALMLKLITIINSVKNK